ncbi:MAG: hypothetical protein ACRDTD_31645, partial [Pseudonocardiaceae bacterium]
MLEQKLESVRIFVLAGGRDFHDRVRGLSSVLRDPRFSAAPSPSWHFGIYAAVVQGAGDDQRILTVHKTRGPYTGMLDLPGGAP